jgi:integrase
MTFEEVLSRILSDPETRTWRRASIKATFRNLAKQLDLDLGKVPATLESYRDLTARFDWRLAGIGLQRWANMRSDIRFALFYAGVPDVPRRCRTELTSEWSSLLGRLSPQSRIALARLARHCSERLIPPDRVNDATADEFRKVVAKESAGRKRDYTHRIALTHWNRAVDNVAGWPQQRLSVPKDRRHWALPLQGYPASFQVEVNAWLTWLSRDCSTGEGAPPRPLKPRTIASKRHLIRYVAGALVVQGRDPETITGLKDLVEEEACKSALRYLRLRRGAKPVSVYSIALSLKMIAESWLKLDRQHVSAIGRLCDRLKPPAARISDKYAYRLHQLDDEGNLRRLLNFPQAQIDRVERTDLGRRSDARRVQVAVAVELLLMAPVRIGRLTKIVLSEHLRWPEDEPNGVSLLAIPPDGHSAGQQLEFELPPVTTSLLQTYVEDYRPRLAQPSNKWLFPGRWDGPKNIEGFNKLVQTALKEEIGLDVNSLLFRYIAAKLYLDANPGCYEVVRRLLGHRSLRATMKMYAGLGATAAVRYYDREILRVSRPANWTRQEAP